MANGPEVAKLALHIDGSGARREVKLTVDQLKALANGGKEAEAALKKAIPPSIVPPRVQNEINGVVDAMRRMQDAARQSQANAFGSRLAIEMDKATASAMRLQVGLDGIRAAQQRMQQAAAISQAGNMAGMIAARDPFQEQAAGIARLAQASQQAAPAVDKLRGVMTTLAFSAASIPGPLGRVFATLSMFAGGGAATLAVVAGITAIGLAWETLSTKQREARESSAETARALIEDARRLDEFSKQSLEVRLTALERQKQLIAAAISAQGQKLSPDPTTGLDRWAPMVSDEELARFERLDQQIRETARALEAVTEAEKKVAAQSATRTLDEIAAAGGRVRESLNEWMRDQAAQAPTFIDLVQQQADTMVRLANEARVWQEIIAAGNAPLGFSGLSDTFIDQLNDSLDRAIAKLPKTLEEIKKIRAELEKAQKRGAIEHVIGFGIDKIASKAGPFGGMVSGIGMNLMAGNPWGAAAAGVTGLIDGILGMREEARRAREQFRQFSQGIQDFIDSEREALGIVAGLDTRQRGLSQRYVEQRGIADALDQSIRRASTGYGDQRSEINGLIARMGEANRAYGDHRGAVSGTTPDIRGLTKAYDDQSGVVTGIEAEIHQINKTYGDQRDAIKQHMDALTAMNSVFYSSERAQQWGQLNLQLQVLNALEAARIEDLKRQQAELERLLALDNNVLRLRLLGMDEQAEALAREIEKQREMNALIEDGGSTRERQLLAEKQHLEDLLIQADKIKERIASLTATIEGLQGFRDSQRLDMTRSPADRLAEAERQYQDILQRARGIDPRAEALQEQARQAESIMNGSPWDTAYQEIADSYRRQAAARPEITAEQMQEAAGRLPEIARTFLDAARTMYGSGAGFEQIRTGILGDTDALIAQFENMRSVEELMLDELRRIALATETSAEVDLGLGRPDHHGIGTSRGGGSGTRVPTTEMPFNDASDVVLAGPTPALTADDISQGVEAGTQTLVRVSQAGYEVLSSRLDAVVGRLESIERTFAREIRGGSLT